MLVNALERRDALAVLHQRGLNPDALSDDEVENALTLLMSGAPAGDEDAEAEEVLGDAPETVDDGSAFRSVTD